MLNTNKLSLLPNLFLLPFSGFFVSSSFLPHPHLYTFIVEALFSPTSYPTPLLVQNSAHLDADQPCHPPASADRPCAPRRVHASATIYHDGAITPFDDL